MKSSIILILSIVLVASSALAYAEPIRHPAKSESGGGFHPMIGTPDDYAILEWKAKLGWAPWGLGIADLSNDGEMEILVGNSYGQLRVFSGSTHDELDEVSIGVWLHGIPVADLDNDGMQEIVTANDKGGMPYAGIVHIFEWNGTNLELEWQSQDLGWAVIDIKIADIDCDDELEVVVATGRNGTHAISYDPTAMSYQVEKSSISSIEFHRLEIADIDNDTALEVIVTDSYGLFVFDGMDLELDWSIHYKDEPRLGASYGLAVGDLEKDGKLELVIGAGKSWVILDPISKAILAEVPRQSFGLDVEIMDIDQDGTVEFFGTVFQDLNQVLPGYGGYLDVFDGVSLEREWRSPGLWFEGFDMGAYRVEPGNVDYDGNIEVLVSTYGGVFQFEIQPGQKPELEVLVDCNPDTLNLRSRGNWLTCYIEPSQGYDPRDIDVRTILLNGVLEPELDPKYGFVRDEDSYIMDHDEDGLMERMVKFDRSEVSGMLAPGDSVLLTISGELFDGTSFEGPDEIRVIDPFESVRFATTGASNSRIREESHGLLSPWKYRHSYPPRVL
jgi:hypothetical protein